MLTDREHKYKGSCPRVLISGAYGMDNIGDEAMLKTIVDQLRSIAPDVSICVLTRTPEATKELYGVDAINTFNIPAMHRRMQLADLFISGGGSLIQNVTSRRSLWYYLHTLSAAKKRSCRVLMYGCGIGPINGKSDIEYAAGILNDCVDCITLREEDSRRLLDEIGVTKPEIIISADLAFSLTPAPDGEVDEFMQGCGMAPEGQYACFGLRPWTDMDSKLDVFADAVRYTYETLGLTPVFILMNHKSDLAVTEKVAGLAGVPHVILPRIERPDLALGVLRRMKLTTAMRLHAALLSVSAGVPVVGISYDPKVSAFTSYVGSGSSPKLETLSRQELRESIRKAFDGDVSAVWLQRVRELGELNVKTLARFL